MLQTPLCCSSRYRGTRDCGDVWVLQEYDGKDGIEMEYLGIWLTPYFLSYAESGQKVKLAGCGALETIEIWSSASSADLFLGHGNFGSSTRTDSQPAEPCKRQRTWTRLSDTCWKTDCASWHMGPGRLVDDDALITASSIAEPYQRR